ncbi:polymer-forming cytoskeletal protein [Peribacillus cavernae]|uniref:Polymer-forming cytoskeletal protein n=1 Tax=Peribacillus cavernae TaxID=1674310 RepID=A0A433HSU4_9BACI|nr:polymer-forming cytoskeletal protein [Peribacillus cavernae]MDQ0218369.1 cytoskeletal protein CcmA (bactofilin family) [Peribacillus cavernae]RUQ31380.1 polymer-forming cytoskeletal protein [Peribacillus cavernae]
METKNRGDLTINGYGASNGGQFHRVIINGKGTINSDVECMDFECNGTGFVNGNLYSKNAKVSGKGKFFGKITSNSLKVEGRAMVDGDISARNFRVSGSASINGCVKSEDMKVHGRLTVDKDCEADVFKAECQFTIGGLLNVDLVDVKIYGECHAQEIGGQTIKIKQKSSLFAQLFKPLFQTMLETELIEGDHIELENTAAKVVRGNDVTIGPNCKIGLVEYTETLTQDKKSIIEESRKI